MADLRAEPGAGSPDAETGDDAAGVAGLFRARYPEMVRLADLLGADDPEDIAQEAFARLIRKHGTLRDPGSALSYVRTRVCNLTRNRHRHLRVARLRTPVGRHADSPEQVAIVREEHREVKNDRAEGIAMCTVTDGAGYDGGGACGPENVPAHQVAYTNGPYGSITMGTALKQVTSVSAQLPGGRTVPGKVVSGRGFPYEFWAVVRYAGESAQIIFRGASGAELGHLTVAAQYNAPSRPNSGGITVFTYPADVENAGPGRMTAYLLNGRVLGVNGQIVGFWDSTNSSAISTIPASRSPAVVVFTTGGSPKTSLVEFYGYAHENVTRVVLKLADGRQYGAQTFAAWPGSGLRPWAFPVPTAVAFASPAKEVLTGYGAAGHVVYQRPLGQ